MSVFHAEKTRNYTVISNHQLKNKVLTLKAKGLLSVMLSRPEDWDYALKELAIINREGIDAIREAIREHMLTVAGEPHPGWLVKERPREISGTHVE